MRNAVSHRFLKRSFILGEIRRHHPRLTSIIECTLDLIARDAAHPHHGLLVDVALRPRGWVVGASHELNECRSQPQVRVARADEHRLLRACVRENHRARGRLCNERVQLTKDLFQAFISRHGSHGRLIRVRSQRTPKRLARSSMRCARLRSREVTTLPASCVRRRISTVP